ncbi:MAG: hypothetical protein U0R69_16225 [Gaiellales bacterium]
MKGHVGRLYAATVSLLAFGGMFAVLAGGSEQEAVEPPPPAAWTGQVETPAVRIVDLPPMTETRSS